MHVCGSVSVICLTYMDEELESFKIAVKDNQVFSFFLFFSDLSIGSFLGDSSPPNFQNE